MAYIELNEVTLNFPIYDVQGRSLKRRVLQLGVGGKRSQIAQDNVGVVIVRALNQVSVRLEGGDRVGLIGHNGSGKTTLLRIMAGIYSPTSGNISVQGKAVPLLDISSGMDENSTGIQNIRLRGMLLGMSNAEISGKLNEIAEFSELGDYLDLPIRIYSSGMKVRLGFAISTAVDAEILLLDEVMGVGDASFMQKAQKRLTDLHARAKIVVLAMHSTDEIRKVCNKVLWMERGQVRAFGNVEAILSAYEKEMR